MFDDMSFFYVNGKRLYHKKALSLDLVHLCSRHFPDGSVLDKIQVHRNGAEAIPKTLTPFQ